MPQQPLVIQVNPTGTTSLSPSDPDVGLATATYSIVSQSGNAEIVASGQNAGQITFPGQSSGGNTELQFQLAEMPGTRGSPARPGTYVWYFRTDITGLTFSASVPIPAASATLTVPVQKDIAWEYTLHLIAVFRSDEGGEETAGNWEIDPRVINW